MESHLRGGDGLVGLASDGVGDSGGSLGGARERLFDGLLGRRALVPIRGLRIPGAALHGVQVEGGVSLDGR